MSGWIKEMACLATLAGGVLLPEEVEATVLRDCGSEIVKDFPGLSSKDLEQKLQEILAAGHNENYVVSKVKLII